MDTRAIRVLVVDDFSPWREFVSSLLQTKSECQVVGEASDGSQGIQKARELRPDIILLDVGLPVINGVQAARQLATDCPESKILFVSENRLPEVVEAALNTGAGGYVVKAKASTDLLPAIKAVLEGLGFVSACVEQNSNPQQHEFRRYANDDALVESFANFIGATLRSGGAAVVLATESNRERILRRLTADDLDVMAAVREQRFVAVDSPESAPTVELARRITEEIARTAQRRSLGVGVG